MKKLLIVDGNSTLNRAFYGIRPLTTKDGLNTNAVFGMLNILLSDGAKEGKRIKEEFTPMFASKEEYFDYIERFYSEGNRIEYSEGKAEVKI